MAQPPKQRGNPLRYGTVMASWDSRNNFKLRPERGGGATVILKGSWDCPFKKGARVMFDCVTPGDHPGIEFAAGYSLADRSWPTKDVIRRMSIVHWGDVLRAGLAAAFTPVPGVDSFVLYDQLLLGGKLPIGPRPASYYLLALVGKTEMDVHLAAEFAGFWDLHGEDPPQPSRLLQNVTPIRCQNGAFAAAYKTQNNPLLFMDSLLSQADHGLVRSLPVPGLVRVSFDVLPMIENEILRLCGESAVFCGMDAGMPAPAER